MFLMQRASAHSLVTLPRPLATDLSCRRAGSHFSPQAWVTSVVVWGNCPTSLSDLSGREGKLPHKQVPHKPG